MFSRIFNIMDFDTQIGLANLKILNNGVGRHPDIYTVAGDIRFPDFLIHIKTGYGQTESKIASNWLTDSLPVNRPGEIIDDVVGNRSVILVPQVDRSYKVKALLEHWIEQIKDPIRCNAS